MELRDPIRSVLNYKGGNVWSVRPCVFVYDAIAIMSEKQVGALPVIEGTKLVGIMSERDYARKVVLKGKSSKDTQVKEIMTTPAVFVTPEQTVEDAMRIMTQEHIRHLPVVGNGVILGVVSIGDMVKWIISAHEHTISQLHSYISGTYPG